jgi:DMSO/TMAO reductase YedYZ molybdopterin-dependent catalytic subunit
MNVHPEDLEGTMNRNAVAIGALYGAISALAITGLTYLGQWIASLPFVPFDIFDWLTRALPGGVITFMIDSMVMLISSLGLGPTSAVAKSIEQISAILLFIAVGAMFGAVLAAVGRRKPGQLAVYGMIGGAILFIPVLLIELNMGLPNFWVSLIWLVVVFLGWGALLGRLFQATILPLPEEFPSALSRRQFLYLVGAGTFTVLVSALGLSILSREEEQKAGQAPSSSNLNEPSTSGPAESPPQEVLNARIQPVPGTRPELTSNQDFYRIDINTIPPRVDAETWRLELTGLVDHPMELTLDDIRSRPAVSQAITLECISNQIGGDLTSTAVWTGIQLKGLLEEAGLQSGAQELYIESVDGFYESVSMSDMMDERTLLVYEMNGETLPVEHGFPLRIYIPNRFGMKQPKWITRMEVIDHQGKGYWVDRGWSKEAIPKTTSVIDVVRASDFKQENMTVPVGGIAYAGARGISKVEVQIDDGPWQAAELRTPPLNPLTWVQWRYEWQAKAGRHEVRVRAYDGRGELQVTESTPPHPNGATGIDSQTATLRTAS